MRHYLLYREDAYFIIHGKPIYLLEKVICQSAKVICSVITNDRLQAEIMLITKAAEHHKKQLEKR